MRRLLLSPREGQVRALVVYGCSNKEIMEILHIAESTVKAHMGSLMSKLNVTHRYEIAAAQGAGRESA